MRRVVGPSGGGQSFEFAASFEPRGVQREASLQPLRKHYFLSKRNCLAENQCERSGAVALHACDLADGASGPWKGVSVPNSSLAGAQRQAILQFVVIFDLAQACGRKRRGALLRQSPLFRAAAPI